MAKNKSDPKTQSNHNILIIDDEADIRLAIKALLESKGYQVFEAPSGKAGIKIAKTNQIDLILCDFFMPNMNGREVIDTIRKDPKIKDTKVILLTVANFGKEGMKKITDLKISAYIQKPFDNQYLINQIKGLLKS